MSNNTTDLAKPHPQVSEILTEIEKVVLEVVQDRQFRDEPVYMDGREFQGCTFTECRLFIKLGFFVATDCNFVSSQFQMSGPANSLKNFLDLVYRQQGFPTGDSSS